MTEWPVPCDVDPVIEFHMELRRSLAYLMADNARMRSEIIEYGKTIAKLRKERAAPKRRPYFFVGKNPVAGDE